MTAYFSEIGYQDSPPNFFEVAVPVGTDVSGYSIAIYDGSGVLQTTLPFPCYATGTLIDTPSGPRPVDSLRAGDPVMTLDHGPLSIRWLKLRRSALGGGFF